MSLKRLSLNHCHGESCPGSSESLEAARDLGFALDLISTKLLFFPTSPESLGAQDVKLERHDSHPLLPLAASVTLGTPLIPSEPQILLQKEWASIGAYRVDVELAIPWCAAPGTNVLAQRVTVILIVVIFIILLITLKPSEAETLPSQVEAASRFWISNSSHMVTSRRKLHLFWRREIPVWGWATSLSYRCPVPHMAPSSSYEVNCSVALFQGNKFLM